MSGQLDGRVALVTGGTRGLGRAIADAFLREGARVMVNGRSEEKGRQALADFGADGAASFVAGDVTRRADCEHAVEAAIARHGRIDILVNNAGGAQDLAPVAQLTDAALRLALDWNLWSTFWSPSMASITGCLFPVDGGTMPY